MKRKAVTIIVLIFAAIGALTFLNAAIDHPNKEKNAFVRYFNANLIRSAELSHQGEITALCGFDSAKLFFNERTPDKIVYCSKELSGRKELTLRLNRSSDWRFYTVVTYPNIDILFGNDRKIASGNLLNDSLTTTMIRTNAFANVVRISDGVFIIRTVDTPTLDAVFKKVNINANCIITDNNLSQRLHDGGFVNDGKLSYDPVSNILAYVNYYSHHVIFFDTSFKLLLRSQTIDTTTISNVPIIRKGGAITHKSPPVMVNGNSCAFGGVLYVRSKLKADNENLRDFKRNEVIDRYLISDGRYIGSFYLPLPDDHRLLNFQVIGNNQLIAVYDTEIVKYKIATE